ncbi:DUF6404 family protein [Aliivibrio fischeri]|uniref:Uncharacterized protein n=1 Tax=Aliivibrio fischeri (strain MJ11) TaxID=388396 RepID=B5EU90_ALIFM|nr:DUF6404 family protein [Aliivibrio fischeri]ACH64511.1 conserved hypothetical protein [Aliivibrio fischeri MJ11]OED53478.1 hypothetical protein BEI46_17595 [Aliivibrio fischeri]
MEKFEFIQLYLKEKGVRTQLTKPFIFSLSKLTKKNLKPQVFELPLKLFFLQAVFGSITWGLLMWLFFWPFYDITIYQLYGALFYGVTTGFILALEVKRTQKRLDLNNWEQWLEEKHFN